MVSKIVLLHSQILLIPGEDHLLETQTQGREVICPRSDIQPVKNQDYLKFPDSWSSALYLPKLLPAEACLLFPFLNKYHHSIQTEIKKSWILLIMCYEEKERRPEANFLFKILRDTFNVTSFNPHNT